MATTQQTSPAKAPAHRVPAEKSSLPALVLLVGWLVPGAGHLLLGKWVRGLLLFASILGMYLSASRLQGKIYSPTPATSWTSWALSASWARGCSTCWRALLRLAGGLHGQHPRRLRHQVPRRGRSAQHLIAAVDAHSLANGRKASWMLSHFSAAAALRPVLLRWSSASRSGSQPKKMFHFGAYCFVLFVGGVILASWLMWAIKH